MGNEENEEGRTAGSFTLRRVLVMVAAGRTLQFGLVLCVKKIPKTGRYVVGRRDRDKASERKKNRRAK